MMASGFPNVYDSNKPMSPNATFAITFSAPKSVLDAQMTIDISSEFDFGIASISFTQAKPAPPPDTSNFILSQAGIDLGCCKIGDETNSFVPKISRFLSAFGRLRVKAGPFLLIMPLRTWLCVSFAMVTSILRCSLSRDIHKSWEYDIISCFPRFRHFWRQSEGSRPDNVSTDRVAFASGKSVTITFTTQSALALGHQISVFYPANFFCSSLVTVTSSNISANVLAQSDQLNIPVASHFAAGTHTFTISVLSWAPPPSDP